MMILKIHFGYLKRKNKCARSQTSIEIISTLLFALWPLTPHKSRTPQTWTGRRMTRESFWNTDSDSVGLRQAQNLQSELPNDVNTPGMLATLWGTQALKGFSAPDPLFQVHPILTQPHFLHSVLSTKQVPSKAPCRLSDQSQSLGPGLLINFLLHYSSSMKG